MEFRGADPLACILGVLPAGFDGILRHRRGEAGLWVRRELGDMGELRGTLQLTLARGAHAVYRSRCRSMATWWASADALEHRVSRARQLAVRRRKKRVERARAALDSGPRTGQTGPRNADGTLPPLGLPLGYRGPASSTLR
jgi:hypothetical protein